MNDRSSWLRLVAEAEAFAFASMESFAWCRETLERDHAFYAAGDSKELERAFVAHVRESAESRSLEALQNLCAYAWYSEEERSPVEPLHRRLVRLAESLLRWNGSSVTLALAADDNDPQSGRDRRFHDVAARWRWLTLRMPADLLIAAVTADKPRPDDLTPFVASSVELAPPGLGRLLQDVSSPVAQTHLHVGAALSSSTLWSALAATQRFDRFALDPAALDRLGALPFGSGETFASMIMVALLARLVFVAWLDRQCATTAPFHEWVVEYARSVERSTSDFVVGDRSVSDAFRTVFAALEDGPRALDGLRFTQLRALYRAVTFDGLTLGPVLVPDRVQDPVVTLLRERHWPGPPLPETWLALLGLRALFERERQPMQVGAGTFARGFWQYQRLRAIFHRFLTQEPGTAGLDWFGVHQERLSQFVAPIDPILPALALQHESARLHMASFEARTTPPSHSDDVLQYVRWMVSALKAIPEKQHRPEIGLVFHFIRTPHADRSTGLRFADPHFAGCRHRGWYQQQKIRANAIRRAIELRPELLVYVRGLDMANLEYSVPTYAFRPLLVNTREASKSAAARLAPLHPAWNIRPLQITVHAGEDYRRLVDGVRRMHELLRYHVLEPGDRVGHGLALGVDPERWCSAFVEVAQPRMDRLEDLLWEVSAYRTGFMPSESGRHVEAEAEIEQLARLVFGHAVPLSDLIALRDDLHGAAGEEWLDGHSAAFNPAHARAPIRGNRELLKDYLSSPSVYQRGCAPVVVRSSERETRMLLVAQSALRKALSRIEITVEANPSSNLLVGGMQSLQQHPVIRLDPPPSMPCEAGERVLVSLNSDDPTTFATSLADEYAHMYFALVRNGHGANDAREWVTKLRNQGWRSRFTLACSRFPEDVMPKDPSEE